MINCSIAMITLNARETLRRALDSVREFSDIVIFDGNSTDDTQAIAKEYGARVFSQSPGGPDNYRLSDFGAEKQKAVDAACEDWVFILDSDEWMMPELVRELQQLVGNDPLVGFVPRELELSGTRIRHAFFYPDMYPRFFHKATGAHFKPGRVLHEKVIWPQGTKTLRLTHSIMHTWPSYKACLEKDRKNQDLVLAHLKKNKPSVWHWFKWVVVYDTYVLAKVVIKMILVFACHPGR